MRIEKHGFAAVFNPCRQVAPGGLAQGQCFGAVDLDHIGLQVLLNEFTRSPLGEHASMVKHQESIAQAFGFVHEVRGQQDGRALLEQLLQTLHIR